MPSSRLLVPLLVLPLVLAACNDETPPLDQEPLEQQPGDWTDEGPFAECDIRPGSCGTLVTFDPSFCARATLESFQPDGIYTVHARAAAGSGGSFRPMAMRLTSDGGSAEVGSLPVISRQVDRDTVYIVGEDLLADGGVHRRAFMGCSMPAPDHLVGCFDECINGRRAVRGTFQARRVSPSPGEPEASGLTLVSESRVDMGIPVDVYVTRGHAYVVSLRSGLYVYDVRDPSRPVLAKQIHLPRDNYWNGVWAKDEALYVASADRGIIVFDLKNPSAPELVRTVPSLPTDVHTVFVSGKLLFGASPDPDGVVLVFDVTEPLQPVLRSKFLASGFDVRSSYGPHDMFAFEQRLYVNYWGAGFVITRLDDPEALEELGRYRYAHSTSHANAVGRFGDRLIAFEGGEDWGAHLRVLDVTDPGDVRLIGEWRLHEHISIHNMVLVGTKLYVAHYQDGVRVLDVSVPEVPRPVAHYNTFRPWDPGRGSSFYDGAVGIRVPGDGYVYTVDSSRGLLILREE